MTETEQQIIAMLESVQRQLDTLPTVTLAPNHDEVCIYTGTPPQVGQVVRIDHPPTNTWVVVEMYWTAEQGRVAVRVLLDPVEAVAERLKTGTLPPPNYSAWAAGAREVTGYADQRRESRRTEC